jgi:hypothetical protein
VLILDGLYRLGLCGIAEKIILEGWGAMLSKHLQWKKENGRRIFEIKVPKNVRVSIKE